MKNTFFVIASLAVAVILWLQVQPMYDPDRERELDLPLEIANLDPTLALVDAPETARIILSGTESELAEANPSLFSAALDLTGATPGVSDATIEVKAPARSGVYVRPVRARVRVEVVRRLRQSFTVEAEVSGSPPRGLQVDGATVTPAEVAVSGPQPKVEAIRRVRVLVDLSRVTPGIDFNLGVEALDAEGRPITGLAFEPATVRAIPAVASAPTSRRVLIDPVFTGSVAFGFRVASYEIRPAQVLLTGSSDALARVSIVRSRPIDLTGLSETALKPLELDLPEGLQILGGRPLNVRIVILPSGETASPAPQPTQNPEAN